MKAVLVYTPKILRLSFQRWKRDAEMMSSAILISLKQAWAGLCLIQVLDKDCTGAHNGAKGLFPLSKGKLQQGQWSCSNLCLQYDWTTCCKSQGCCEHPATQLRNGGSEHANSSPIPRLSRPQENPPSLPKKAHVLVELGHCRGKIPGLLLSATGPMHYLH